MKKENTNLSRRRFLAKGGAVAAVSSIIAIETLAAPDSKGVMENNGNVPVQPLFADDGSPGTLTNKTIPSRQGSSGLNYANVLGTDYVNIREFSITGFNSSPTAASNGDITTALDSAINVLKQNGAKGGQILIPHGKWTSNGGHEFGDSISIEGVNSYINAGGFGTEIKLNTTESSDYMFKISAPAWNCSLKNLSINLSNKAFTATGVLITNPNALITDHTHGINIENVGFYSGGYGIKVDSLGTHQFECIVNRFDRLTFNGCRTAFYCNSGNGGYSFNDCFFQLPTINISPSHPAGTALDCVYMGNLSLNHCLFVGLQANTSWVQPNDGSTLLKTTGAFNNITFNDCQDENIEFYYKTTTTTNHIPYVPIVLRNCLVQSKLKFTANGAVVFDSCRIGVFESSTAKTVEDSSTGFVLIHLTGLTSTFSQTQYYGVEFTHLTNDASTINKAAYYGSPYIPSTPAASYTSNKLTGIVKVPTGASYILINNQHVKTDSIVFAQQRTADYINDVRIRNVVCYDQQILIALNYAAYNPTEISYLILN